jgi:sugar phosphate isomerase/epimerase
MKIGVSSYSFSHYMRQSQCDYFHLCDLAKEMGFEGIEFIDLNTQIQPAPDMISLADAIRAHCEAIGLPIIAYSVYGDFIAGADEVTRLKKQVDVCRHLGAKILRHDVSWTRELPWRDIITQTAPAIRQVADYAGKQGIRTCTENHGFVLQDAHRVETLILTVDHPNFGWLVDMGNFLCADEPPMHAMPIAAPYAVHAHAKDFLVREENPGEGWFQSRGGKFLRGTVVGHGDVNVRECVRQLRSAGYDGWLSLEFEGMERNLDALRWGLAYLQHLLRED